MESSNENRIADLGNGGRCETFSGTGCRFESGRIELEEERFKQLVHLVFQEKNPAKQGLTLLENFFNPVAADMLAAAKALCRDSDMVIGHFLVWPSSLLNLISVSPSHFPAPPDWPDHFHLCGFFSLPDDRETDPVPDELQQFLDAGESPVYMTFGSMLASDPAPHYITRLMVDSAIMVGGRGRSHHHCDQITNNILQPLGQICQARKLSLNF